MPDYSIDDIDAMSRTKTIQGLIAAAAQRQYRIRKLAEAAVKNQVVPEYLESAIQHTILFMGPLLLWLDWELFDALGMRIELIDASESAAHFIQGKMPCARWEFDEFRFYLTLEETGESSPGWIIHRAAIQPPRDIGIKWIPYKSHQWMRDDVLLFMGNMQETK